MLDYPWAVHGVGRENTVVMEDLGIIAKSGAEGVLVLGTDTGRFRGPENARRQHPRRLPGGPDPARRQRRRRRRKASSSVLDKIVPPGAGRRRARGQHPAGRARSRPCWTSRWHAAGFRRPDGEAALRLRLAAMAEDHGQPTGTPGHGGALHPGGTGRAGTGQLAWRSGCRPSASPSASRPPAHPRHSARTSSRPTPPPGSGWLPGRLAWEDAVAAEKSPRPGCGPTCPSGSRCSRLQPGCNLYCR